MTFACDFSPGIVRLGTLDLYFSLGNCPLITYIHDASLERICRLSTFACELSLDNFELGSSTWELSFGIFDLGPLWILGFGPLAWDVWLAIFCFGSLARDRWLWIYCLGS